MNTRARCAKNSNMGKAHVTFDESKHIVPFKKGEDSRGLRHHFIRVFSDELSDEVVPAQVKFQRFDEHFKDYVNLTNEDKLEEDIKVKAIIVRKRRHQGQEVFPWPFAIPSYCKIGLSNPKEIDIYDKYQLWNPVYNDTILRRDSTNHEVKCDGTLGSTSSESVVSFKISGDKNWPYLLFFNTNYVVVGQGAGNAIKTSYEGPTCLTGDKKFDVSRIGAFTMFKNSCGQFLGCDDSGTAVLMSVKKAEVYPNPQALFIATIYEPPATTTST